MALVLQAASRESLADLNARLDVFVDQVGGPDLETLGDELFAVTRLLAGQTALRRRLADASVDASARAGLVEQLLGGKVGRATLEAVSAAASARWSRPMDLVDAVESMARNATLGAAEKDGAETGGADGTDRLDEVEDELFRFGRILDHESRLAGLLADTGTPVEGRIALLDQLLDGKVTGVTAALLRQTVRLPRGRHLDTVAEELAELAAARRQRSVARVSTPVSLTTEQEDRLRDSLTRLYGRPISLQIELDEALLGGLVVRVGGEVIDGSVAGRLEAARRNLPR